jgi:H+/Cl- antiporter ClcA
LVGDLTARALGVVHNPYPTLPDLPLTWLVLLKWCAFALVIAAVTALFIELTHVLKRQGTRYLPRLPLRMACGGLCIVGLWQLSGTDDYLGLGVPGIMRAFVDTPQPPAAFAWKLLFTAITLGAGFLGGEVTPLFFIGATLGHTLAGVLGLPVPMAAGVGLAAVFAAAANTPLALSIMALELFGRAVFPHVVIVCVLGYLCTGQRSIYPAQLLPRSKTGQKARP